MSEEEHIKYSIEEIVQEPENNAPVDETPGIEEHAEEKEPKEEPESEKEHAEEPEHSEEHTEEHSEEHTEEHSEEHTEEKEPKEEPEDTSTFLKEEVIPEHIENANIQKLMQIIPDVKFEDIYKEDTEPVSIDDGKVVKKEWTRLKGEDLYAKIASSTKPKVVQFTETPIPITNVPNIKLPPVTATPSTDVTTTSTDVTTTDTVTTTSTDVTTTDTVTTASTDVTTKTTESTTDAVPPTKSTESVSTTTVIPEIVFIVPYRDREHHRKMFADAMKALLKKSPPYKIFYVHQTDKRGFNRGAMKNIGFLAVKKLYPEHYKNITLVFNDVDTMPTKNILLNYKTTKRTIKHFYGFNYTLGGIVSINAEDFESLNGFPNFWAWGYEDNLLQIRAMNTGIVIDRSVFYKIHDPRIIHLTDSLIREVNREEFDRYLQNTTEGLDSIGDLDYTINDATGFIDVLQFNTNSQENLEKRTDYDLRNGPAPFIIPPKTPKRAPTIKMFF